MSDKRSERLALDSEPGFKARKETLGSPAMAAQKRLISATGRTESDREGRKPIKRMKERNWKYATKAKEYGPLKRGGKKTRKRVSRR